MLWPENPEHNPNKIGAYQRVMVPRAGRKFVFTRTPGGSYTSVGKVYTCGGYPNHSKYYAQDIYCISVQDGSGTYDRISAWVHAEWHYVEEEG